MARVTCEHCGLTYDDTYRWTYCPHDHFEMLTLASRGDGAVRWCTSVKELKRFMDGEELEPGKHCSAPPTDTAEGELAELPCLFETGHDGLHSWDL